jgi:HEAT repeat protein
MLQDPDWRVRVAAMTAITGVGAAQTPPESLALLLPMLQDPDWRVRIAAMTAIADVGAVQTPPESLALLLPMLQDPESEVRVAAVTAIDGIVAAQTPPERLRLALPMLEHPEWRLRGVAVTAIGDLGGAGTLLPLARMTSDASESVSRSASEGFDAEVRRLGSSSDLTKALMTVGPNDRATIILSLRLSLSHPPVLTALLELLSDPEPVVRSAAADSLGYAPAGEATQALAGALSDPSPKVRERAAWSLGSLRDEQAVEALIQALADKEPHVRFAAARALGNAGNGRAERPLVAALSNEEEPDIRAAAAWALGQIGSAGAAHPLIAALSDSHEKVREEVAAALGDRFRETPGIGTVLAQAFKEERSDSVRKRISEVLQNFRETHPMEAFAAATQFGGATLLNVKALGERHDDAAAALLIGTLSDRDSSIRYQAIQALGKTGNPLAIPALTKLLDDEVSAGLAYYQVGHREDIICALQEFRDSHPVVALTAALRSKNKDTRLQAVEAAGKRPDADLLEPLLAALKDSSAPVRKCAVQALGAIHHPRSKDAVAAMIGDVDDGVRYWAVCTFGSLAGPGALIAALAGKPGTTFKALDYISTVGDRHAIKPVLAAFLNAHETDLVHQREWREFDAAFGRLLARVGDSQSAEELVAWLVEESGQFDAHAITAPCLRQISRTSPSLVASLLSSRFSSIKNIWVRYEAAVLLSELGGLAAIKPHLPTFLSDWYYRAELYGRDLSDKSIVEIVSAAGMDPELARNAAVALRRGAMFRADSVLELCRAVNAWSNYVLYLIAKEEDSTLQRQEAKEELIRRGLSVSDPQSFLAAL